MIDNNITVIAVGGEVSVIKAANNSLKGVKLLLIRFGIGIVSKEVNADLFVVSTAVEKVSLNYNKPNQIDLKSLTLDECQAILNKVILVLAVCYLK